MRGIARITSADLRQVRFENKAPEQSTNVVDGTLIEQFVNLDGKIQQKIVQNMLLNSAEMTTDYLTQVKTMVQLLT